MITRFHELPLGQLQPLIEESKAEGFRFLQRLGDDWQSGANRFDQPGEALFGYYADSTLLAVGGINRQSSTCGRLRRFYVSPGSRRTGIGRSLVLHILSHTVAFYEEVVLHTETPAADAFYRAVGFSRMVGSNDPTHSIKLKEVVNRIPSNSPAGTSDF